MRINSGDESIPAYLATPVPAVAGTGPWPGVVIVHDAFGLTTDVRTIADRFATAGFLALVPDLFSRGGFARCVRSVLRDLQATRGQAFDDIDAARRALINRKDCTSKIGVAGFCMGGGFAIIGAATGFDASAPYYGELPHDPSILDGSCPIVASFGRKDPMLPGRAERLEKALTARDVPHDVKEYPNVGHSFANRLPLGPFNMLARVTGFGYDHAASEDAWRRVMTCFGKHLH